MSDDLADDFSRTSPTRGHLHFPLRGLASAGAGHAIRQALEDVPGILHIEVSSVMAVAEVEFDEALVSAAEVRARLQLAGRPPRSNEDGAP